jgi:dolichyl-phosphate beta-glucosyltransferase
MSVEAVVSISLAAAAIVGLAWILHPAWLVLVADELEWAVEQLDGTGGVSYKETTMTPRQPLLSLVIPAYNEQDRIAVMLHAAYGYLISQKGQDLLQRLQACVVLQPETTSQSNEKTAAPAVVEWLIVNDGSKDETCRVVRSTFKNLRVEQTSASRQWDWKIVTLGRNSGKGAAVKTGMLLADGHFRLMVDADGATDFGPGLERLTEELQVAMEMAPAASGSAANDDSSKQRNPMVAAFGSRAHLERDSAVQRSFVRTLLMKAFHFFVGLFVSSKIHDTQCGFKLFTRASSLAIFRTLHLRRWAFDTEIVLLCHSLGIQILEVNVPWQEVDGSKLSTSKLALAVVSITMLRDMICVRTCYTLGIWKVKSSTLAKKQR